MEHLVSAKSLLGIRNLRKTVECRLIRRIYVPLYREMCVSVGENLSELWLISEMAKNTRSPPPHMKHNLTPW